MKIVIIFNTEKWKEHTEISVALGQVFLERGYEVVLLDMPEKQKLYEKKERINSSKPNLIITLDLVGFEMRTLAEKAVYNAMPYRMAHILLRDYAAYEEEWLNDDMSFSMFFYGNAETVSAITHKYPEIENVIEVKTSSVSEWIHNHSFLEQMADTIVSDTEIEVDYQ